ncbi:MAG: hypothetical protein QOD74_2714 [Variibacter sp.]|nr:hypothetical protein [Variibacter sp.]
MRSQSGHLGLSLGHDTTCLDITVKLSLRSPRWFRQAGWATLLCCGLSFDALAAADESRFTMTPDGSSVDFELRSVTRREVMDRLFAGQPIKLEWVNKEVAEEVISGNFSGPRADVVRQLLQQTNFVLTYTAAGQVRQVSRVLVLGRAAEGKTVTAAANTIAQQFPAPGAAKPTAVTDLKPIPGSGGAPPVAMPGKGMDLKPIPRAGGTAPAPPLPTGNVSQLAVPMPTVSGAAPMPMPTVRR